MSNTLAIAAVTKTLAALITPAVTHIAGAVAVAARPDEPPTGVESPHVRIFLYRVEPNAAWRNCDLPTRRSDGTLAQRPQAALNLQYLLSFHGAEHLFEPHRLLASTVLVLHEQPLLDRDLIQSAVGEVAAGVDNPLADADLAAQPERVRLTPLALGLDDLTKVWTVFPETAYQLSVAYEASVVLINSEAMPNRALPVREPRIYAITLRRPHITRVVNAEDPRLSITDGDSILIQGSQLRGEITRVRLVGKERDPATGEARTTERFVAMPPPPPGVLRDDAISFALPEGLLAGLVSVQVLHQMTMGEPPTSRPSAASNLAPLLLQPRVQQEDDAYLISLADDATCEDVPDTDPVQQICAGEIAITIAPAVARSQHVGVLLNRIQQPDEADEPSDSYGFPATPNANGTTLTVPFAEVRDGTYLVRVQVDSIDSPLIVDEGSGAYAEPAVEIP
ncbi:MAG: hypothetical protein K0Q71_357 [Thermomicrobiales bacterium]|jgi:hypothetical protein|nr:hypothetical protein [Thermomicrobiales bacterium]